MGGRAMTGTFNLPKGCVRKKGSVYRRFKVRATRPDGTGYWKDHYVSLPDPLSPLFAVKLAECEAKPVIVREAPKARSIGALCAMKRAEVAAKTMPYSTRKSWNYYLDLIETEHGARLVKQISKSCVLNIQSSMIATPGKANGYISKLRALLEIAVDHEWIGKNPAAGIKKYDTEELDPWPAHVLEEAIAAASPMVRLLIFTGLYTGQRLSDVVLIPHGRRKDGLIELWSKKTNTYTPIVLAPEWAEEIAKLPIKTTTILYDRMGKPWADTSEPRRHIRNLMRQLGYVSRDRKGNPLDAAGQVCEIDRAQTLYSFHGLGKNACCYLTELGLSDTEISAISGKTPETVRYYARQANLRITALGAAEKIKASHLKRVA